MDIVRDLQLSLDRLRLISKREGSSLSVVTFGKAQGATSQKGHVSALWHDLLASHEHLSTHSLIPANGNLYTI